MTKRLLLIRHNHGADDDRVTAWCQIKGVGADIRRPFAGEMLGDMVPEIAGCVIYGGMYNAYDTTRHPFLNEEYRWIDTALAAGLPMLGICQGAQMIAHHLGAFAGAPAHGCHEFGYYPVTPTQAGRNEGFLRRTQHFAQAHFHTFGIPSGAVRLAGSEMFENQAFRMGETVFGLQFHPEVTIEAFRRWQDAPGRERNAAGMQPYEEQCALMHLHDAAQAAWFTGFLDRLFASALLPEA